MLVPPLGVPTFSRVCEGIVRMTMGMRIVANEAKGEMPMCLPENAFMRYEG